MTSKSLVFLLAAMAALFSGCGSPTPKGSVPVVAVSIAPQKYFVGKIARDLVSVMVMVPPGVSEHTYEPKPLQMASLSRAALYFSIGIEFEHAWLARLAGTYPRLRVVPTDSGIVKRPLEEPVAIGQPADTNEREGLDPHIWLSPELVKKQAATITDALCASFPVHAAEFRTNDSSFMVEIDSLQNEIRALLAQKKGPCPFMVFHPAWGYFAREFGLKQLAIEIGGKEPSARTLGMVMDYARGNRIETIYVQPQFSRQTADIIATEIGARVAIADPLAADWADNLRSFAQKLVQP
jgi:zinc transport system substrate-binding protein